MRLLLLFFLTLNLLNAQKIALLIGNSKYSYLDRLSSPPKDIPALAKKLRSMNFKVVELHDLNKKAMKKAIKDFKRKLQINPNAIALFYYSGHGSQAYGDSYLIPIDGDTRDEADVEADGIKVEWIAKKMALAGTKANILFLDACRDVPIGSMGGTKGLGQVRREPSSTLILYSTSKNKTAKDDRVFNKTVLENLGLNIPFSSLANDISYIVSQKTDRKQVPELLSTGLPKFCLIGDCNNLPSPTPTPKPTSTSKWIKPTNSVCRANGGKIDKDGGCRATWENAKKICSVSGGKLPTRDDFHKVITNCGGIADADNSNEWNKNENNNRYQSCYKQKGFSSNWYWTSETNKKYSSLARGVYFKLGGDGWVNKSSKGLALCVR